jgi:hypothetical protein
MAEIVTESQGADRMPSAAPIPTNGLSSPAAHPEQDDDSGQLRGIVAFPRKRNIMFTDEVELDSAKLPRWRPHICVDMRRLADDVNE